MLSRRAGLSAIAGLSCMIQACTLTFEQCKRSKPLICKPQPNLFKYRDVTCLATEWTYIQAYCYVIMAYGNSVQQPVGLSLSCSVETVNKALRFFTSPVVDQHALGTLVHVCSLWVSMRDRFNCFNKKAALIVHRTLCEAIKGSVSLLYTSDCMRKFKSSS